MNNVRPLHDWIVVDIEKTKTATDSGIILTEAISEKIVKANIVAAGPGVFSPEANQYVPVTVEVGQTVAISAAAVMTMDIGNQQLSMIKEDSIIGLLS